MFQADPKRYDLLGRVNERFSDDWSMNQHRNKVSVGDLIYFRISGKQAGLYVTGRVVGPVFEADPPNEFGKWKIDVEYEALIEPPLLKAETLVDPLLATWLPLSGQLATNFIIPPAVAARLDELTSGRRTLIEKPIASTFDHSLFEVSKALDEHRAKVKVDLVELLGTVPPAQFEAIIRLLLEKVGYEDAVVVGKAGDGGVDVRATLRLRGVTAVPTVVQAKRWKGSVPPEIVQQMRGALKVDEHGVVITTSHFTKGAIAEADAEGKRPIALVDGPALADLLIDNDIGVRSKLVSLPTIDAETLASITADTLA